MSSGMLFNTIYEDAEEPNNVDTDVSITIEDVDSPKKSLRKVKSSAFLKTGSRKSFLSKSVNTIAEMGSEHLFPALAIPSAPELRVQDSQSFDSLSRYGSQIRSIETIMPKKIVKPKGYVKNFIIQAIAEIQSKYKTGKGIPIVDINTFPKCEEYNPKKADPEIDFLNRFIHSRTTSDFITNKLKNTRINLTNGVESIKFPDEQPVETVAVRTLLQELMDEKAEFERVSFKTRDIGTQVDTSILSMDSISDLYKKLRDDLDITQEMIRMNQRQQLKENVMKSFGNILNTLKSMREEIDASINNERVKCAKEIGEALQDLKEENKIFYKWVMENQIEKNKAEVAKRMEDLKTFKSTLKKRKHELEKIQIKAFKINNAMIKHKINLELEANLVPEDPQEVIKRYQNELHTKIEEINDLRFKLSEYGYDDKVDDKEYEKDQHEPKTHEQSKEVHLDTAAAPPTTLNEPETITEVPPQLTDTANKVSNPVVDERVLEMEKYYHEEIRKVKDHRAQLSCKWVEKIQVALKLQSNTGIKQLLRRQTRLLQFAYNCKQSVKKVDHETQDCLQGYSLQDLKENKHIKNQEAVKENLKVDSPTLIRAKNLKTGLSPLKIETQVGKVSRSQLTVTVKSPSSLSPRLRSAQLETSRSFSKRTNSRIKSPVKLSDGYDAPFSPIAKSVLSSDLLIHSSNSLTINSKPNVMEISEHKLDDEKAARINRANSRRNMEEIGKQNSLKTSHGSLKEAAKLKEDRSSSHLREIFKAEEITEPQFSKLPRKAEKLSSTSNLLSKSAYSIPVLDISLNEAKVKSKSRPNITELEKKPSAHSISKKFSELHLSQRFSLNSNDMKSLKIVNSTDKISEKDNEDSVNAKSISSRPTSSRSKRIPSLSSRPNSAKTTKSRKSVATDFVVDYIQQSRPDSPTRSNRPQSAKEQK
ncbi:hypothetical protein HDV06_000534 [Boothiomyces sp. JEL0866]|nr:hypothetical protein HDV06_000534 [Boothiomyces sp. JEL0866]